jgi:hypothetical protein
MLKERTCTRVYEQYPGNFTFEFGEGSQAVDGLWRIIEEGQVRLSDTRDSDNTPLQPTSGADASG